MTSANEYVEVCLGVFKKLLNDACLVIYIAGEQTLAAKRALKKATWHKMTFKY